MIQRENFNCLFVSLSGNFYTVKPTMTSSQAIGKNASFLKGVCKTDITVVLRKPALVLF